MNWKMKFQLMIILYFGGKIMNLSIKNFRKLLKCFYVFKLQEFQAKGYFQMQALSLMKKDLNYLEKWLIC